MEPAAQGHGKTFALCHALFKKAILLHKRASVRFYLSICVRFQKNKRDFIYVFLCVSEYRISLFLSKKVQGKSAAMPLHFWLQTAIIQGFQMRYWPGISATLIHWLTDWLSQG